MKKCENKTIIYYQSFLYKKIDPSLFFQYLMSIIYVQKFILKNNFQPTTPYTPQKIIFLSLYHIKDPATYSVSRLYKRYFLRASQHVTSISVDGAPILVYFDTSLDMCRVYWRTQEASANRRDDVNSTSRKRTNKI